MKHSYIINEHQYLCHTTIKQLQNVMQSQYRELPWFQTLHHSITLCSLVEIYQHFIETHNTCTWL